MGVGPYDLSRVRVKSDNNRLPVNAPCFFFEPVNDLLVPEMNAVKSADGDHRVAERR
jgi:hypothetical protein